MSGTIGNEDEMEHIENDVEMLEQNEPPANVSNKAFLDLNEDCISEILRYLGPKDLVAAVNTCTRLQPIARRIVALTKNSLNIRVSATNPERYSWYESVLKNFGNSIEHMTITFNKTHRNHRRAIAGSKRVLAALNQYWNGGPDSTFIISDYKIPLAAFNSLIERLPAIKLVDCENLSNISCNECGLLCLQASCLSKCFNLETSCFPKLQTLFIGDSTQLQCLKTFIDRHPHIKEFKIAYSDELFDLSVIENANLHKIAIRWAGIRLESCIVLQNMNSVEELYLAFRICGDYLYLNAHIMCFLINLASKNSLKKLEIVRIYMTEAVIKQINCYTQIQWLQLHDARNVTIDKIIRLNNLRELRTLCITDPEMKLNEIDANIDKLTECFPKLEELCVNGDTFLDIIKNDEDEPISYDPNINFEF